MAQNALIVLINSINAQLEELNKSGYHIFDKENPDYHISVIDYNFEEDKLYFNLKELDKHAKAKN